MSIKNTIEISGFQNPIDKKLIEIIKKTEWTSFDKGVKDKVPENSKLLIGIYFYPKEKENPEFFKSILSMKNNWWQQCITAITADSTTSESTRNCERQCLTEN